MVPSVASTMMVTVFLPSARLTWWPVVWVSASAGVMVTVALESSLAAVTVGLDALLATLAVYSVDALLDTSTSLSAMASVARSALSDRVAKMVRVMTAV